MEQLRVALDWVVKYHFWLLSVLAIVISSLVWWMAAGDLDKRKQDNLSKIKTTFGQLDTTERQQLHANEGVIAEQEKQITALAAETESIWRELYDRQRKDVLKWPPQLPSSFRKSVEGKQFGDEMDLKMRADYSTYITSRYADLPKLIEANALDEKAMSGGGGGGRGGGFGFGGGEMGGMGGGFGAAGGMGVGDDGNPTEVDYKVYWQPDDQQRIAADLDWPTTQSHWRIWVTQEDLWVYEAILRAVDDTNEAKGGDRISNAAINYIGTLQVGRDAAKESRTKGRIKMLAAPTSGMEGDMMGMGMRQGEMSGDVGMAGGMGDMGDMEGMGMGRGGMGEGDSMSPAAEKQTRLSGRYVDDAGQPIPVAADEEPLQPGAFGQEVKRLPVRMVIRMDTRWLPQLITELANADLQIQVTEVRMGDNLAEGSGGGSFGGRGGGMGMGGMGALGGGGERGFGGAGFGSGFGGDQTILAFDRQPYMKQVVIQGIVLIFNPPDATILHGDGEAGDDVNTNLTSL